MAELLCEICYQVLSLENFWFSTCGHGYCGTCTASLKKSRTCPSCRKPRKKSDLHKIYFALPEQHEDAFGTISQSQIRATGNKNLCATSSSLGDAIKGLKRLTGTMADGELAQKLHEVEKDLEQGFQVISYQLRLEQDEKRALQEKVNLWARRVAQTDKVDAQSKQLKEQLDKAIRANQTAITTNKELTRRLATEQNEIEQLRKDVIDERRWTKEREEQIHQLEQELEATKKQAKLTKKKLKHLARDSPNSAPDSVDDTLIVDPAVSPYNARLFTTNL
ncbi:hypothetical protein FB446DRAFT_775815 [Lentinula raphanica]|nr:hypothetical protein FB446DRAFT_775815 [Lentinula raphanica]